MFFCKESYRCVKCPFFDPKCSFQMRLFPFLPSRRQPDRVSPWAGELHFIPNSGKSIDESPLTCYNTLTKQIRGPCCYE